MKKSSLLILLSVFVAQATIASCNWKNRIASFGGSYQCGGAMGIVYANCTLNDLTGIKFEWTKNGVFATKNNDIGFPAPDGVYDLCLKISDTLSNCDTIMCIRIVKSCTSNCNWKNRMRADFAPEFRAECAYKALIARVLMANYTNLKYEWTVNGVLKSRSYELFDYANNGVYNICLKLTDTLLNCDTSICATVVKNCSGCQWKERIKSITFGQSDSCPFWQIGGSSIIMNDYYIKYNWKVDGVAQQKDPSPKWFYNTVKNGTYMVCLELSDTFLNCDTSICKTLILDCDKLKAEVNRTAEGVKLFPNPGNDMITLDYGGPGTTINKIECYSITGKLVMPDIDTINPQTIRLNISQLDKGLYIICILDSADKKTSLLFMKE